MAQTPILGPRRRRLSVGEAATLQGLPRAFDFGDQPDSATYRQLGNGVNVGVVRHVLRKHVERDLERLRVIAPGLVAATGVPSGASVPEPALI